MAPKALRWLACIVSFVSFAIGFGFTPTPARADGKQEMVYEVYAGGIHALQATLSVDTTQPDRYDIELFAKTRGLLGKLAPWHGTFESHGWRSRTDLRPELHRSTAVWRGEKETKTYRYNYDGSFAGLTISETGKPDQIQRPDEALTNQTTDALTSTLQALMRVTHEQTCAHSADVFDGKRRFTQAFIQKNQEQLIPSRYNIYDGLSVVCSVEIIPKGGAWHKKPRGWMSIQEQGRQKGTMPTVWMAQVKPGMPAVPIKILVKTNYGTLFMHLAEYKSDGTVRVAEKRVTQETD